MTAATVRSPPAVGSVSLSVLGVVTAHVDEKSTECAILYMLWHDVSPGSSFC